VVTWDEVERQIPRSGTLIQCRGAESFKFWWLEQPLEQLWPHPFGRSNDDEDLIESSEEFNLWAQDNLIALTGGSAKWIQDSPRAFEELFDNWAKCQKTAIMCMKRPGILDQWKGTCFP
jgi:hypothetical protein